jgi:hypothetical protein
VDDWAGMMAGVQGLLVPGGWFVGTEFGREEGERDRVKEAREIVAAKKREAAGEGAQVSLSSLLTSLSPRGPGRPEVWKC